MKLRDHLPRRISDPLFRVQSHVTRRTGGDDPIRERRKRREAERQPRIDPALPSEIADLVGHTHGLTVTRVVVTGQVLAAGGTQIYAVSCPGGSQVIGGGWLSDTAIIVVFESYPFTATTWRVTMYNPDISIATNDIWAICIGNATS